jgi:hypothetical protein
MSTSMHVCVCVCVACGQLAQTSRPEEVLPRLNKTGSFTSSPDQQTALMNTSGLCEYAVLQHF